MTVFGGDLVSGYDAVPRPAETWELVLDEPIHWVKRASAPNDSVPIPETGGAFVPDRAGDIAWLFPGDQGIAGQVHDASVWQLDLVSSTWTRVQSGAGGPDTRSGMASTFVPSTGEVLLHGGYFSGGLLGISDGDMDTWRFKPGDPSPWGSAAPAPRNPTTTADSPRMLFDESTRTLFRHDAQGVWTCDLGTDAAWRLDAAGAVYAPPYVDPVNVIDPVRRRLLVFGGASVVANQLWSWPLDGPGAWTVTPIDGAPPSPGVIRGNQRAYDPAQDRVIVLSAAMDTVPALELGGGTPHWARLATQGGPPPHRWFGAVALDAARDRLLLSGGDIEYPDYFTFRDLWTLDLSGTPQWTLRIPQGGDPGIWPNQGMMVDPDQDRALLFGGYGQGLGNTIYASPLATLSAWTNLDPDDLSPMWGQGVAFYDAAAKRGLFWNGTVWEITWPGSASAPPPSTPPAHALALAAPRPNPTHDHVTLVVETASAGDVTLEVFDTAGRRVGDALHRRAPAGRSEFGMRLPHGLAPGVYLVRARQDAHAAHVRLAVTR